MFDSSRVGLGRVLWTQQIHRLTLGGGARRFILYKSAFGRYITYSRLLLQPRRLFVTHWPGSEFTDPRQGLLLPFEMNRIRIIYRSPNDLGVLAGILRNYIPMFVDGNKELSIRGNLIKFE